MSVVLEYIYNLREHIFVWKKLRDFDNFQIVYKNR